MRSHSKAREGAAGSSLEQKLARRCRSLRRFGAFLALLLLSLAFLFAFLDPEPISQRTVSFIVLGFIPAILTWMTVWLLNILLREVVLLYDSARTSFEHFFG
jgi:hypothetical protein